MWKALCLFYIFAGIISAQRIEQPFPVNVARGKKTFQSGTTNNGASYRAVDGNRDNQYRNGSCIQTSPQESPWWTVDLGSVHRVNEVWIVNRIDCCADVPLHRVYIGLGMRSPAYQSPSIENLTLCAKRLERVEWGDTLKLNCGGKAGRFLTVILSNTNDLLTVCEIEVYGIPISSYKWAGYEFDVVVDQNSVAKDDGSGVTGKISCNLRFQDPSIIPWPKDFGSPSIDLYWEKHTIRRGGGLYLHDVKGGAVYGWNEMYDGFLPQGHNRYHRGRTFADRFSLMIDNANQLDEGRYCCSLNLPWGYWSPRRKTACTDFHYKLFDSSKFVFQCKMGVEYKTVYGRVGQRILVSKKHPATIYASVTYFYPGEHSVLDIVDINGGRRVLAQSRPYRMHTQSTQGTVYAVDVRFKWTEPRLVTLAARLTNNLTHWDQKIITCDFTSYPYGIARGPFYDQMTDDHNEVEDSIDSSAADSENTLGVAVVGVVLGVAVLVFTALAIYLHYLRKNTNGEAKENEEGTEPTTQPSTAELT